MAVIAHISDLHFPYTAGAVRAALLAALQQARPRLLVLSGDLTQRGREAQFAEARRFVEALPEPRLIVPGNHDVPLYDLRRRFFLPTERFQRYICDDLMPSYSDDELFALGVNSTRAFTLDPFGFWKNGTLSGKQLDEIRRQFAAAPASSLRILVMHHPLINPWNEGTRDTARHRKRILRVLGEAKVDVVLSGHLHINFGRHAPATSLTDNGILCVQAGTACSTRLRGEAPAFNILDWVNPELKVVTIRFDGTAFVAEGEEQFKVR